ncbi:hypothetical protein BGX24_002889 [Mortierella sp. AD032]|nr:hypothetical protein BGX24_002889 [Mortierella sp. AD032]
MGANISGDDYEADDKEVFQSYRIPPKAYKKKNSTAGGGSSTKSLSDGSHPVSPTSVEFGKLSSFRTGGGGGNNKQQQQQKQGQQQQRLRAGSIPSDFSRSRRDRPISHPSTMLSPSSSTSSLNLSIVNAAVAAGSPTPSLYGYPSGLVSAPITLMSSHNHHGAGVGGSSRTNSGYSVGSDSFDFSAVGSGLGRATYVNGKMVEAGAHGANSPDGAGNGGFYMHNNYTVQDFMSYQQQQQQQFLEQQQLEYQQMMILRQQQQQLKLEYEQKQLALLQQQQNLHQNSTHISGPVSTVATGALPRPSQDYSSTQQITGVVLQTKTRRPARNPDRALSSQNLTSGGSSGNGHHRNTSHAIAIPDASQSSSLQRQPHASQSSPHPHHQAPRSPTMSNSSAQQHHHNHHYSTSPPGSMASSSYTGGASSFSSTGSHYHTMLAMTSAASPPSSSSSSLSNPIGGPSTEAATVSTVAANSTNNHNKATISLNKSGLTSDELAARILPLRRLLGGREYYPDKTLPYLLPCDEQESER